MISKIDIARFGVFKQYAWDTCLGRDSTFKKLNIIYGRNYSGKTTISRILDCIQNRALHADYSDAIFSILLEDGNRVTQNELDSCNLQVRVYNTDFVKKHLGWMYDHNGQIEPFTILGSYNVELDQKIKELEDKIGDAETQTGLSFAFIRLTNELNASRQKQIDLKTSLEKRLSQKANDIKRNTHKFNSLTYNRTSLEKELELVNSDNILSDEIKDEYLTLIKEEPKDNIDQIIPFPDNFDLYLHKTNDILQQNITLSQPIAELLQNKLLQEWVRNGRTLHAERNTCAFCGNNLPSNLWERLDKHFNTESENLRSTISQAISEIDADIAHMEKYLPPDARLFYDKQASEYAPTVQELKTKIETHVQNLNIMKQALNKRLENIFEEQASLSIVNVIPELNEVIGRMNDIIKLNNELCDSLQQRQNTAKDKLRASEVAESKRDINYPEAIAAITVAEMELAEATKEFESAQVILNQAKDERRSLKNQAQDKSKGAELVNQLLAHYFGHEGLKLVATGQHPQIEFKIMRGDDLARNLSEGECSLIAFCYFIARMQDELKYVGSENDLIICIDDPVSSLDHNHIFFMFGMIESVLCKNKNYKQLFILTHNLELLKYLKQLTQPEKNVQTSNGSRKKKDVGMFLIERESSTTSKIKLMPKYMHNYITEFNYLFEQIYNTSQQLGDTATYSYHYNFGNNLRKFLEAYLFYKYPDHELKLPARLDRFFGEDSIGKATVQRFINDYSHLESHPDRGISPILPQDAKNIATLILDKMKDSDNVQFEYLLKSINVPVNPATDTGS
ncbi:MAG: AAA family ATPase [Desulfovibrio sp.]|uniref:AAA family ATPase n=1 Tax=Desulfovibrio sp. TaxID=885 RepID=UPI002586F5DB|nr:AAA family ATPase [Desulfovibrio sp.]MCD7985181.1 AAA family ATPase [Desulfovibrio sp.]